MEQGGEYAEGFARENREQKIEYETIGEDIEVMEWHHIYPVNDLIEHNTDSIECACNPKLDFDAKLVIHNSLDRREVFENDKKSSDNSECDSQPL